LGVSWLEGPKVTDDDPWDLEDTGQKSREWDWFGTESLPAMTDGGDAGSGSDSSTDEA
jgi:cytochrome c oxidase subunit 1